MKKIVTLLFSAVSVFVILTSSSKSSGGRTNATGSPVEGTCTSCHGSANANGSVVLRSNIPAAGYTAGTTYQMKVVVIFAGRSSWGFDVEVLNSSNASTGTLTVTDAAHTRTGGTTRKQILHSTPGATTDSMVYNFNWTAPATGSGTATFYYAGLAANGDGNNDNGDYTYTGNAAFSEYVTPNGVENIPVTALNIYPNPAVNEINILTSDFNVATVEIYSLNGMLIQQSKQQSGDKVTMNISNLNTGVYLVKMISNGKTSISKLVKE